MTEKKCTKCGETKVLEEFHKHAGKRDGRCPRCKECRRADSLAYNQDYPERQRVYRLAHREEIAERQRVYRLARLAHRQAHRQAHHKECREKHRAYYLAHLEQAAEYRHAYRLAHPEKVAEQKRAYRLAHLQEAAEQKRAYYLAHHEEYTERRRAWALANPGKKADRDARRRARKCAAVVEAISRSEVYARDGGHCHVCGKKVNPKRWHLDHLVPLSLGGEHSYRNVAVACVKCNLKRGHTGPAQLRLIETLAADLCRD